VFLPGFSTAEKVTSVSGRGVGLDVVKTNVEKIGGTVDLQSVSGQGTTVHIKIPLTLAVVTALIVSCAGQSFAIPQVSLAEIVRLEPAPAANPIETLCGAPVYRLRERLLPLCFLAQALGLHSETSAGAFIVVLQAGADQFGLVVDAIRDTEEIVVKPLAQHLNTIACFAGAAVLGDGQVVLILDVAGLTQVTGLNTLLHVLRPKQGAKANSEGHSVTAQSWLICRATSGSRFALPLPAVSRLEEIAAGRIERSAGREVVPYDGEIIPLLRLSRLFNEPEPARERLPVVVLRESGHSAGLVVDGIEDIVEDAVELHDRARSNLLQGTVVIRSRVADVLSVKRLLARAQGASDPRTTERIG
jgi:two-component system, chemotaxis family, sensor kinase CheA